MKKSSANGLNTTRGSRIRVRSTEINKELGLSTSPDRLMKTTKAIQLLRLYSLSLSALLVLTKKNPLRQYSLNGTALQTLFIIIINAVHYFSHKKLSFRLVTIFHCTDS